MSSTSWRPETDSRTAAQQGHDIITTVTHPLVSPAPTVAAFTGFTNPRLAKPFQHADPPRREHVMCLTKMRMASAVGLVFPQGLGVLSSSAPDAR